MLQLLTVPSRKTITLTRKTLAECLAAKTISRFFGFSSQEDRSFDILLTFSGILARPEIAVGRGVLKVLTVGMELSAFELLLICCSDERASAPGMMKMNRDRYLRRFYSFLVRERLFIEIQSHRFALAYI